MLGSDDEARDGCQESEEEEEEEEEPASANPEEKEQPAIEPMSQESVAKVKATMAKLDIKPPAWAAKMPED